jgi:sRNA-binding regulator protein Hfq
MGIPRRFAQQIAAGHRELNEVLQEMARHERVDKLVAAHDIPRSLAVQVVLGQADLDAYLSKRRRHMYRCEQGARSIFDDAARSDEVFGFGLLGRSHRQLRVLASERFELNVEDARGGEAETIHKLTVKFVYSQDDRRAVRRAIGQDKAYKGITAEPVFRIQDRYHCPDKTLFPLYESEARVSLTTTEGDRLQGTIEWFSRYEIGLRLKGDVSVVVMRHALVDVSVD